MGPLLVDIIHFYPVENAQPHYTKRFEVLNKNATDITTTIVRRGQPFNGVLRFNRPYDEDCDIVKLVFRLGNEPYTVDTTASVVLRRDPVPRTNSWSAKIADVGDQDVSFEVSTPVNLPVGNWAVRVITTLKNTMMRESYTSDQDLYILFNPWNPDDQTYMPDTNLLQEYVLNDFGKMWLGRDSKPWIYGQFDTVVLPAVMAMLDKAEMPFQDRGDPVKVSRAISRIVNSNDDDGGVVTGRWDGQYEDGTAPMEWTGSVDILEEFMRSQEPVYYGQCWVFAGVVTTVCRALGIPSRVVTIIKSGHDTDRSLTVDEYYEYSETEKKLRYERNSRCESIWNYHLWNDVWMARPDLPSGYGGWQAIDATPQEPSSISNKYECGPAPVEAIKQGVTDVSYDVDFLLASVNADMVKWIKDPQSETGYSEFLTVYDSIGLMVLTKKPFVFDPNGDEDRQDILGEYKHREGSTSERLALINGIRTKRHNLTNDITFKLRDIDTVPIGKEFRVVVDLYNSSEESRLIYATLKVNSVYYNGVKGSQVKNVDRRFFIGPSERKEVSVLVTPDDYLPNLVEYCNMKIFARAYVEETKQAWADDDNFQFLKPSIKIEFNEDLIIGQTATAVLSFVNPLDRQLTGCEFKLSSLGIAGRNVNMTASDAKPSQLLSVEMSFKPTKTGKLQFVATFKSAELKDIIGAVNVEVLELEE
ncbi:hemocyte protein-glutamine gamma-glutamyltransferase [Bicyclus anynana]|uniref:Hemocyte protein-glutamine gamma-glutamyltransferase n=1 Tax=Bicyclus anynana TaxID=110368 RepID=A0ABM3LXE2_BICAN|nr:hemocyte protein-glutamine gamma-glutamyltransferase [Bicyclus anynana]